MSRNLTVHIPERGIGNAAQDLHVKHYQRHCNVKEFVNTCESKDHHSQSTSCRHKPKPEEYPFLARFVVSNFFCCVSLAFSRVFSKKYLEGTKLADVSEHLIIVKIPASHGHWRRPDCMHGCRSERKLLLKSEMCSRPKKGAAEEKAGMRLRGGSATQCRCVFAN